MRKHEELWNSLKESLYLQITAPKHTHAGIMRSLRWESDKDTLYRYECVEKGRSYYIGFNSVGDLLFLRIDYKTFIPKTFTLGSRLAAKKTKDTLI